MARVQIKGSERIYRVPALNEITVGDVILFNVQAADLGIPERWHDVEQAAHEIALLKLLLPDSDDEDDDDDEVAPHPLGPVVLGATLWLARRHAGEDVSLSDAVDVLRSDLTWLPDPEDLKVGKAKGARKRPKASGRAARRPAGGSSTTRATSASKSSTA